MTEDLSLMLDSMDELLDELRGRINTCDQVCFALCEEAADEPNSTEIPALLVEAGKEISGLYLAVLALQGLMNDIAKELLS